MESTYKPHLVEAGLTPDQASLYETLVRKGTMTARKATLEAGISRTLGYAVLKQLEGMGLVLKSELPGSVATFSPAHPSILEERIEQAKKSAERAMLSFKAVLPDLASNFNLATGRPGVRFYEGREGVREVLFDTLTSKEIVYTYADIDTVDGYAQDINDEYVRVRNKRGVGKKILMPDTPAARAQLLKTSSSLTEVRLIPEQDAPPLHAAMQIYDGKISYTTFTKDMLTATIIHDQAIYRLHRFLFEQQWKHSLSREDVVRA